MDNYEIRCLKREELDQLKEMSDVERWNHSMAYIEECFDLNPNHFYCAAAPDGTLLSTIGWLPLGGSFDSKLAWLGFFVTRKEHRGKGIGKKLFTKCFDSTGDFTVGLSSMVAVQGMYKKLGFIYTGENITQYFCPVTQDKRDAMKCPVPDGLKIIPVHDCNWEDLLKYDNDEITPIPRERCLELFRSQHHAFYVAVKDGQVVGYGCVRRGSEDFQLKPLYADDKSIAQCLMNVLLNTIPSEAKVELQVLEKRADPVAFFSRYGMVMSDIKDIHMFTQEPKQAPNLDRVYCLMDYNKSVV